MRRLVLAASVCLAGAIAPAAALERPAAEPFLGLPENPVLVSPTPWDVEVAYPNLGFDDPVFVLAEPGTNRLWVAEREGRLVSFEDDEAAAELHVALDLRDVTQGDGDSGMLSIAFHPEYAEDEAAGEGQIFVAYARLEDDEAAPLRFRLSRFQVDRGTGIVDPESETILIEQIDQNVWHQGGALLFHPDDGFLYVSVGDEGGGRCLFNNCQRIDRDLFSGVLRLDVDCREGTSHAPPRQPETGTTSNYCIPDDNPFVGVPGVLEEFYAIGLRSPHRMTHDPVDDLVWIGEVGQSKREELDVLAPAANFQWNVMEGSIPFENGPPPPEEPIGVWTPPLLDYGREVGGTVIGGYVYRGKALPALEGRYLYGDFLSGRIWALQYAKGAGGGVTVIANEELVRTSLRGRTNGITSFGLDRDGEILVLTLGEPASIYRLVASEPDPGDLPATLSETGLFDDLATLDPIDALVPYDVAVPLWSDGTFKRRWMSVPSQQAIGYSPRRPWTFPDGSVFVKHFELATDAASPLERRRLETRVLVRRTGGGIYGVTYRWREDESDADLLLAAETEDIAVRDADGVEALQRYLYPGPRDCEQCHAPGAGSVLGLRARQFGSTDGEGDQLEDFAGAGYFELGAAGLDRSAIPAFAPLGDEGATAELRVRSYLDANCAHCHGSQDLDRSLWDARITTPLNRQGIVLGSVLGDYGSDAFRIVTPDAPDHSAMWLRTSTTEPGLRMPPLARSVRDEAFLDVLAAWIAEVDPADLPPVPCGDVVEPWDEVTAGDALFVLRAAVGLSVCRTCTCDADQSGSVSVTDALRVLREAVGMPDAVDCAPCEPS